MEPSGFDVPVAETHGSSVEQTQVNGDVALSIEDEGGRCRVSWGERELFTYVYEPDATAEESPRPYFHPVRSLDGVPVTAYRPAGYEWHHGISVAVTNVSGHNFWGGATYVNGSGYVNLANHGRVRHLAWQRIAATVQDVSLEEVLEWGTNDGEVIIEEARTITVTSPDLAAGAWRMRLDLALTNVAGGPLEIASPGTEGRPDAGYGGLFWRGPTDFAGGLVIADARAAGRPPMGVRSAWLAYVRSDPAPAVTLVFADLGGSPHPTTWFFRDQPYAGVNPALAFHERLRLEPGATMRLAYSVTVADGVWDRRRILGWLRSR